jgi:aryl-alcohol dehydrogenase-like predicted oxidoreductase
MTTEKATSPMGTRNLGPLQVTRLSLGTMLMGGRTPRDESYRMLDRYLEAGGNFLDTADVYGDGESERTLAPWLASHRDEWRSCRSAAPPASA